MTNIAVRQHVLGLPLALKLAVSIALDAVLTASSVFAAYYLRLDDVPPLNSGMLLCLLLAIGGTIPLFALFGLYRTVLRFSGWATVNIIVQAVAITGGCALLIFTFFGVPGVPRSIGIMQPVLLILFVAASRLAVRVILGGLAPRSRLASRPRVLIYGAGSAGRQLASALNADAHFDVTGYIDDNRGLQGRVLNGLPVWDAGRIEVLVLDGGVTEILIAIPSASRSRRNEVIRTLHSLPVHVQTLPALADLARHRVELSDLREVEIEDLLGREPVAADPDLLNRCISGKCVLITGAGGSIGSELCRQIKAIGPDRMLIVDSSEFALYSISEELSRSSNSAVEIISLLADVTNTARIEEIFKTWRPNTVYHAAAYKHVPLVEHNVAEGLLNNSWGTLSVANAAAKLGVSDFVLISTDKAVRPTNIMGASKRLAELILQAFAAENLGTCFAMVRFGNVLGSSGSVVPRFRSQISQGGPVTVTHPDITRYFMTISEAAHLVIQAGAMASGGDVFLLDMGEPVRIIDLARNMIELSGFTVRDDDNPDGDMAIEITGLRPGEKLYEELLIGDNPQSTRHPRIMRGDETMIPFERLSIELEELRQLIEMRDIVAIRSRLGELIPGYSADGPVVDWVATERRLIN